MKRYSICQDQGFYWPYIDSIYDSVNPSNKFYACGAGLISLYIRMGVEFYPCPSHLKADGCIGNSENGYDSQKISFLKSF